MKIVIFTGAGVSAESGISTFRDSGGLWEKYRIEDVATPGAWKKNPELVLEFYNQRRKQILSAEPATAHFLLAELEKKYPDTQIITQNIDDLHERAGSKNVLHLHGEIKKARSTIDDTLIVSVNGWRLDFGDLCPLGSQLRPHVVWFGEEVPAMIEAISLVEKADILIVIGTSLNVYPAAGLIHYSPKECVKCLIDPLADRMGVLGFQYFNLSASAGLQKCLEALNL